VTPANILLARPNRFEIDLDAISYNTREVRRIVGAGPAVFAALKANAYGFGLLEVARTVLSSGANALAMTDLRDAIRIREHRINAPILLYGGNLPNADTAAALAQHDIMPTISDYASAEAFSRLALLPIRVFVKVDVGAGRLGVLPAEAVSLVRAVHGLPRLSLQGIYTHMHIPAGDGVEKYATWQFRKLQKVIEQLESQGIPVPVKMAASTSVLLLCPGMELNAVDPGHMLYGLIPPGRVVVRPDLRPAFRSLKSRLIHLKPFSREDFRDQTPFPIQEGMRVGVLPIGLSDGMRFLNCGQVLIRGRRMSILGVPSLEHTRLDLTDLPEAEVGDEVVIIGEQEDAQISPEEVIARNGLKIAELALAVQESVPRVYLKREQL
jgi:alanine racemase